MPTRVAAAINKYAAPRRVHHNYEGNFLFRGKRLLNVECGDQAGKILDDEVVTYKILKTEVDKVKNNSSSSVNTKVGTGKSGAEPDSTNIEKKFLDVKSKQEATEKQLLTLKTEQNTKLAQLQQDLTNLETNTLPSNYIKTENFNANITNLRIELLDRIDVVVDTKGETIKTQLANAVTQLNEKVEEAEKKFFDEKNALRTEFNDTIKQQQQQQDTTIPKLQSDFTTLSQQHNDLKNSLNSYTTKVDFEKLVARVKALEPKFPLPTLPLPKQRREKDDDDDKDDNSKKQQPTMFMSTCVEEDDDPFGGKKIC